MIALDGLVLAQGGFRLSATLDVPRGAIAAVSAPSGGRKSTLLAGIAGFLDPLAGRIRLDGADMAGVAPAGRPVTMLFQDHNLFAHLRVWQNVGLGLAADLRLGADGRARVDAALAAVGLPDVAERRPGALSGGQQSRVALARALLRRRPILLLDEPFAALGPALRAEMLDLVARIAKEGGLTVLMVTHDPGDAVRIATHGLLVAGERAEPPRPLPEFLGDPSPALSAYLGPGYRGA